MQLYLEFDVEIVEILVEVNKVNVFDKFLKVILLDFYELIVDEIFVDQILDFFRLFCNL